MNTKVDKANNSRLLALREEIDKIDDQILNLLRDRMSLIAEVKEIKNGNNEKFFIRSSREADMIKRLVSRADVIIPKSTIVGIWRKIIAMSNMNEQLIHVAIHNPKNFSEYNYLVREYYSDIVPTVTFDSATNIVSAIEKGEMQIGVFALPSLAQEDPEKGEGRGEDFNDNWWISLANNKSNIKVFTKIPFVEDGEQESNVDNIQLVAVAIKDAEESENDNTLLYVEASDDVSRSQILSSFKECDLKARILKFVKLPKIDDITFSLVEVLGFHREDEMQIKSLAKSKTKLYVRVLGWYPVPIKIGKSQ